MIRKNALLVLFLALTMFIGTGMAQAYYDTNVNVKIDGKQVNFPDQGPYIDSDAGRTFVPISFIALNLGATVEWNDKEKMATITKGSTVVKIYIGNTTAYVNGQSKTLDSAARITGSRTMVPLAFIGLALNCDVQWDANTRTVMISTTKPQDPKVPAGWVEPKMSASDVFKEAGMWSIFVAGTNYGNMQYKVTLLAYESELNGRQSYDPFRKKWMDTYTTDGKWHKLWEDDIIKIYDPNFSSISGLQRYENGWTPKGKTIPIVVTVKLGDYEKDYNFTAKL